MKQDRPSLGIRSTVIRLAAITLIPLILGPPPAAAQELTFVQKVLADDPATGDSLGTAVAIQGTTAVVGAPGHSHAPGTDLGAVYFYDYQGAGLFNPWNLNVELSSNLPGADEFFGAAVALDGNLAILGAPGDPELFFGTPGRAEAFQRGGGGIWAWTADLEADENTDDGHFGRAVAISGLTAMVGAPDQGARGAVFVFTLSEGSWTQDAKLEPPPGASLLEKFGTSVAMQGNLAVIGSPTDPALLSPGSAYVYQLGLSWNLTQTLTAGDGSNSDRFGQSVSLFDQVIAVGAPDHDDVEGDSGSVYVFEQGGGGSWSEVQKLQATPVVGDEHFGFSVSVTADSLAVGAPADTGLFGDPGRAFLYRHDANLAPGSQWALATELTRPFGDNTGDFQYGTSVGVIPGLAVVGRPLDDDGATDGGSTYFPELVCGSQELLAGQWTLVGLSCDSGLPNPTVADIWGSDLDPANYDNPGVPDVDPRWAVWDRDEFADAYRHLELTDIVEVGRGYWVLSLDHAYWAVSGGGVSIPDRPQGDLGCDEPIGCYDLPLVPPGGLPVADTGGRQNGGATERFNMLGHPTDLSIPWADVQVEGDFGKTVYVSPADAESNGVLQNSFWRYESGAYQVYDDGTLGMVGVLDSFDGFWVKVLANGEGATLIVPGNPATPLRQGASTAASAEAGGAASADAGASSDWFIRLIAEADGGLRDPGNVLGHLSDSKREWDRHDLEALEPFSAPYLDLVFRRDDWGEKAGEYNSEYRGPRGKRREVWAFTVKSDDPNREVTISWEGDDARLDRAGLYDPITGESVRARRRGEVQTYTFSMAGTTERTLYWVVRSQENQ